MDKRLAIVATLALLCLPSPAASQTPNVVVIYADDLGYGDVSAYGAKAISTPNIDRLARAGLRFTDAHSSAATCTRRACCAPAVKKQAPTSRGRSSCRPRSAL